jgi:3-phenylpropionate/cinnamic acid dioxygenase small subunit
MTATTGPGLQVADPSDIQELIDRVRITDLISRLVRCLDSRDFEGLRNLFTAEATVSTAGGTATGHDALVEQARRRHSADQGIQHFLTNLLIDRQGDDRAVVRANLLVSFARTGVADPAPFIIGEVYDIQLDRTGEGWRMTAVASTTVWTINRPASLTFTASRP